MAQLVSAVCVFCCDAAAFIRVCGYILQLNLLSLARVFFINLASPALRVCVCGRAGAGMLGLCEAVGLC